MARPLWTLPRQESERSLPRTGSRQPRATAQEPPPPLARPSRTQRLFNNQQARPQKKASDGGDSQRPCKIAKRPAAASKAALKRPAADKVILGTVTAMPQPGRRGRLLQGRRCLHQRQTEGLPRSQMPAKLRSRIKCPMGRSAPDPERMEGGHRQDQHVQALAAVAVTFEREALSLPLCSSQRL